MRGFVFFPQDYFGDTAVRLMPGHLRIVWVEAFLLMDQSPRRGVLLKNNGQPYSVGELASIMNVPVTDVEAAIEWVTGEGIAAIDEESMGLCCRRMVRDEERRNWGGPRLGSGRKSSVKLDSAEKRWTAGNSPQDCSTDSMV